MTSVIAVAAGYIRHAAVAALLVAAVAGCTSESPTPSPPPAQSTAQVSSPPIPGTGPRYVAMGDSAAAAPFVPKQAEPAGCLKSTNDYPSVLARRIGAASFVDVTCSGARTVDLVSRAQVTRTGPVPPQLDAVGPDTELVTITIGGNDVDLPATAEKCRRDSLAEVPCSPALVVDGVDRISQAIDAEADDWSQLIDDIRAKAPGARVLVVGYGTYVRPDGCFPTQPINPVDAAYFQARLDELDERLKRVATDRGAEFFDTAPLSVGHDICAAPGDRYIEGFVPMSPAAPLHPNGSGAAAFGNALADYLASKPAGR
jgi:lysophospholipase L1-like esterase